MRSVVRSFRELRHFTQHHAVGHSSMNRLIRQQNAQILCSSTSRSLSTLRHNGEVCRFASPGVELLRSMFSTVAVDSIKDVARAGPMGEYERRITSGELVDGDSFQLNTVLQIQRLYEELIENEEACQLDRYQSSKKSGRSRWLWSRLITQPSTYAPVKGLYLHGGVGTGKTMLMDLFYQQLDGLATSAERSRDEANGEVMAETVEKKRRVNPEPESARRLRRSARQAKAVALAAEMEAAAAAAAAAEAAEAVSAAAEG